jgi:two-component system LytT family sensor kinase
LAGSFFVAAGAGSRSFGYWPSGIVHLSKKFPLAGGMGSFSNLRSITMSRSDHWTRFFWKYLFPFLYGLFFYTIVRLVSDLTNSDKFWERRLEQNVVEVVSVVLLSFWLVRLPRYYANKFKKKKRPNNARTVFLEFGEILLSSMVVATAASSIIHVLSHDYPIGIDDLVIVNVLLGLFLLLHYAIVRGNDFVQAFIEQKLLVEKIRNDQLQTELKFLKAQFHPHFLFNALNTVYPDG